MAYDCKPNLCCQTANSCKAQVKTQSFKELLDAKRAYH